MAAKIKTIMFDFSGVLTKKKCFDVLSEKLSKKYKVNSDELFEKLKLHNYNNSVGRESTKQFWEKACKGTKIKYEDFVKALETCYELDDEMIKLVKDLKNSFELILISDNYPELSAKMRLDKKLSVFDEMFFSNEMEMRKSDYHAFVQVLREINRKPNECLMIDDKQENVNSARKAGMNAILFKDVQQLRRELEGFGILE